MAKMVGMMGNEDPKDVLKESRKKKMFSVTTFLEVCELCFGMFFGIFLLGYISNGSN